MSYKFNDGYGAIICDVCRIIIKEGLSYEEYNVTISREDVCKDYNLTCKKENENEDS